MDIVINGYRITNKLYESSQSLIYQGDRENDQRPVILKILKENHPKPLVLAQFKQEYEILNHFNLLGVVKTYGLQRYHNSLVIILEDFGGKSLNFLMKEKPLTLVEFIKIAIPIVEALVSIHAANIIHKDINPTNIIFNPETEQLKIIDFGISTLLLSENVPLGNPNLIEGTLAYISPEQTGRMNRTIDYRTDFYSLGVTFYKMLTNQLPFMADDAMGLVHLHLAKQPISPHELNPKIPKILSEIVMRLLAKTAEDRYQTAWGIKADLEKIDLDKLHENQTFVLGEKDISSKLQIPQQLYGRQPEITALIKAFERVMQGRSEMMLVSGYSGIGKSALVREIYRPITQKNGYFISGKCDQFKRNIPYSSLIQACQELISQLFTECDAQMIQWRQRLLNALGVNGQVIIDVIPEIELIIGQQPEVPQLPPSEAQNRFNLVFQNFIKVFAKFNHPLVIFLDDLQWADSASLQLIALLMTSLENHYLFVIGAYRDNEVSAAHPLMLTLDELRSREILINHISLSPLDLLQIEQLIIDTFKAQGENTQTFAEIVYKKTDGNPFFIKEFLRSLYTKKLLFFDELQGVWYWNIEKIKALQVTENVVELMIEKIQATQKQTQEFLKIAACIGNKFDLKILSLVCKTSQKQTANYLWEALQIGLILPLGNHYKLINNYCNDQDIPLNLIITYKFSHDRVHQAAYSLISVDRKQELHLLIGQILLKNTSLNKSEEKIFDIVDQFNIGRKLITNELNRNELAQLNLMAGKRAKLSSAYQPALNYFTIGLKLLEEDKSWKKQYELTLNFHVKAAEAAYLDGKFEFMEQLIETTLTKAETILDKVKAYEVQIQAYTSQNKLLEAIDIALTVLKLLGINIPKSPSNKEIQVGLEETHLLLRDKRIKDLIDLPQISDPTAIAAIKILASIIVATYLAVPKLFPLIVTKQVNLSIQYGNSPDACFAYACYGQILCQLIEDFDTGYEWGKIALNLLSKFKAKRLESQTLFVVTIAIRYWKEPLQKLLKPLLLGYQSGLETGSTEYAMWNIQNYCAYLFAIGVDLKEVEAEMIKYIDLANKINKKNSLFVLRMNYQVVLNLMDRSQEKYRLLGKEYNEEEMLPIHLKTNYKLAIFHLYSYKLILCYLLDDFHQAINNAVEGEKYIENMLIAGLPKFRFYESLALLAIYAESSEIQQKQTLEKVVANQANMQIWVKHNPSHYRNKFYLVKAEIARVLGNHQEARDYYDRAIITAQEREYIHEEALAYELAAKFYLSLNQSHLARYYLQDAHYAYQRWGAIAKVKDLEEKYSQFLAPVSPNSQSTSLTTTGKHSSSALDLTSVIKGSQTILGEVALDKLLEKLMKTAIENAGAEKGFLILEKEGRWMIEAEGAIDSDNLTILQSIPIDSVEISTPIPLLSSAIINYVTHTQENVVLNDATHEGKFTRDPYIIATQPKSILCIPLLHQGKLSGIVYLENNLTTGAFTPERVEILTIFSTSAAISIENSRLYEQLEDYSRTLEKKVEIRTQELRRKNQELASTLEQLKTTQAQIIAQEKLASLGALTAGIAHEIKNPLNFVNNFAELCVELSEELQEEIDSQKDKLDLETTEYIAEILDDLKQNSLKINEHGRRADKIVRGMLMHSRGKPGQRQLTDINALLAESINLAYHGLRVRDSSFNITIETYYDSSLDPIKVIPQELSRVFLNAINNACYAVHEKKKTARESFIPLLCVSTQNLGEQLEIRIRDNGVGIPQEVVDKIFNPFFTTKPTGEGTGLGLSISHDIIVQGHQGTITVESEVDNYTELKIILPSITSADQ